MRHYEIVFILNIKNELNCNNTVEKYKSYITENKGIIHRLEIWGCRDLSYNIKKFNKAFYFLLNIECNLILITNLKEKIKIDDIIIRNLILRKNKIIKNISPIMKEINIKNNNK